MIQIVLIIIILGLLAFCDIAQHENQTGGTAGGRRYLWRICCSLPLKQELEDIDVESKSETRKMIEKFVDENPESAAALLRNWLNEDWN